MSVKFRDAGPNIKECEGVRFQHFHDSVTGRLCMTIASKVLDSGKIRFAAAIASSLDQPSRKIGKRIALARLMSERNKAIELDIVEFRRMIADRTIIKLFNHADNYKLKPRSIIKLLTGE